MSNHRESYVDLYYEDDIPLPNLRRKALSISIYLIIILVFFTILLGSTYRFPNQIDIPFTLMDEEKERVHQFNFSVLVLERFTSEGASVKKGDPVVGISSPEIVEMIGKLREVEERLSLFRSLDSVAMESEKGILQTMVQSLNTEIENTENELRLIESAWAIDQQMLEFNLKKAEETYQIQKSLYREQVISNLDLMNFEKERVYHRKLLATTYNTYERNKLKIHAGFLQKQTERSKLQQQIRQLGLQYNNRGITLEKKVQQAERKFTSLFSNYRIEEGILLINADTTGTITYMFQGDTELQASAVLFKLRKGKETTFAMARTNARNVGRLKNSDKVVLKLSAFPHYEWGSMTGAVDRISLTPDEKGQYNISISISNFGNLKSQAQPGMDGLASVIIEEKTLFGYLFRNMQKKYFESLSSQALTIYK